MSTTTTIDKLKSLKLAGMAQAFEDQIASTTFNELSFEERIAIMIDREATHRSNRNYQTRLRLARLKEPHAHLEDTRVTAGPTTPRLSVFAPRVVSPPCAKKSAWTSSSAAVTTGMTAGPRIRASRGVAHMWDDAPATGTGTGRSVTAKQSANAIVRNGRAAGLS